MLEFKRTSEGKCHLRWRADNRCGRKGWMVAVAWPPARRPLPRPWPSLQVLLLLPQDPLLLRGDEVPQLLRLPVELIRHDGGGFVALQAQIAEMNELPQLSLLPRNCTANCVTSPAS